MSDVQGIRTTVEFQNEGVCPIASASARTESAVNSVSTNVCLAESSGGTLEVSMDGDAPDVEGFRRVFSYGSTNWYRLDRGGDDPECPCEWLGKLGCPVAGYTANEGSVTLVFHAADFEELQRLVGTLREEFPSATVKRFIQSSATDPGPDDSVFVDRGRLTARQREVVRTAYEMGYFESPRGANASEVAAELGITQSTFSQHLASAEGKLFEELLKL